MVDASIGGKTAINFNKTRNFMGIFNEAKKSYYWYEIYTTESLDEFEKMELLKLLN